MTAANDNGSANQNGNPADADKSGLEAKNKELLGELKALKDQFKPIIGVLTELGIDPKQGNIGESIKSLIEKEKTESGKSKGEIELMETKLKEAESKIEKFANEFENERNQRKLAELGRNILGALDQEKISAKGKEVLELVVKSGLTEKDGQFVHVDGDKIYSASDYAKVIAKKYPEFVEGGASRGGTGTRISPEQTDARSKITESIKTGNTSKALNDLLKMSLQKG